MNSKAQLSAPVALKKKHLHEKHGDLRQDDYFWLRDDNRQDPLVLDYLKQENAFTEQQMAPLAALQTKLYEET